MPVPKSGDKRNIVNYRPISIISAIPKVLDSIVAERISDIIFSKIIQEQHGFIKGRSTVTNLLLFSNVISDKLSKFYQLDTIYLDFSKAFDTVSYTKLLLKLKGIGFGGTLLKWLSSPLKGGSQIVNVKGYLSDEISVTSGGPV